MSTGPRVTYVDHSHAAIAELGKRMMPRLEMAALIVRDAVVLEMQQSTPSGRLYYVPGTKTLYRASAPGEAPATRENLYGPSWKSTPAVKVGNALMAAAYTGRRVGKAGEHVLGEILEYGSLKAGIAPRPHVRPAIAKSKRAVRAILRKGGGGGAEGAP
jgi:hypothetical protein